MNMIKWTTFCSVLVLTDVSRNAKGGARSNWTWGAFSDEIKNGSSRISVIEEVEPVDGSLVTTYNISGEITGQYEYGYTGWYAYPDDPTMAALKGAKSFSFKVIGDGQSYFVMVPSWDIKDDCYHRVVFTTEKDKVKTVTVSMDSLWQPEEWGIKKEFNRNHAKQIQWQTTNNGRPGTFRLKIWDLNLHN